MWIRVREIPFVECRWPMYKRIQCHPVEEASISRWWLVSLTVKSQYSIARGLGEQAGRRSGFGPRLTSRGPRKRSLRFIERGRTTHGKDFPEIIRACRGSRVLESRWKCSEKERGLADVVSISESRIPNSLYSVICKMTMYVLRPFSCNYCKMIYERLTFTV